MTEPHDPDETPDTRGAADTPQASPTAPARWQAVAAVVQAALDREPGERALFVARACEGDLALRAEAESLLAADGPDATVDALGVAIQRGAIDAERERIAAALAERYTIERELGQGGMATVYLARDLRHGRAVAIKVFQSELSSARGAGRFLREISTAANLSHPHVVPLFDSGRADDLLYYVMPYVAGESLRERLRRASGPLPSPDVLRIVREVADALDHAHRRGVVHRDVKPENILLDGESGHALVADFGIARAMETAGASISHGGILPLSEPGSVIGTPAYMSPEQALGQPNIDGRSDVYALGCVAFEMLTGTPAFAGVTVDQLEQRLAGVLPSLAPLRPDLAAVDVVLHRALAVSPAARFDTAGELADALAAALASTSARASSNADVGPVATDVRAPDAEPHADGRLTFAVRAGIVAVAAALIVAGATVGHCTPSSSQHPSVSAVRTDRVP